MRDGGIDDCDDDDDNDDDNSNDGNCNTWCHLPLLQLGTLPVLDWMVKRLVDLVSPRAHASETGAWRLAPGTTGPLRAIAGSRGAIRGSESEPGPD